LDIQPFMLSRWRKEYREGLLQEGGQKRVDVKKIKKAISEREVTENIRLKKEIEKLKKGTTC